MSKHDIYHSLLQEMTTIRYFVPEDGDKEEHPNIFLLPKSQNSGFSPRLKEIKENFPMPGSYHFRFKSALIPGSDREKNAASVWMDCVNDDQHVGVWRNTIVAKVTRINMDDYDEDFHHHTTNGNGNGNSNAATHTTTATATPQRRAPQRHPSQPRATAQPPAPSTAPIRPAPPTVHLSDNLLGLDDNVHHHPAPTTTTRHNTHPAPAATAPSSGEGSLLDMNLSGPVQASSSHDDFLGMTSAPVQSARSSVPVPAVPTTTTTPSAPNSYGNQQGRKSNTPRAGKAFDTFAQQSGPFGGLEWK